MTGAETAHTWQNMDAFKEALKAAGYKATSQRVAVHQAMMSLGHASADDVFKYIDTDPQASRITVASVYNFLSQMVGAGIYGVRMSPTNKTFYDVNPTPHIHLYNRNNDSFCDIEDEELMEELQLHFRRKHFKGRKVTDIEVVISCAPSKKTNK